MPRKWCARTQPMASPNSLDGRLPGERIERGSVLSDDDGIACEAMSGGGRQQQYFARRAPRLEAPVGLGRLVERQLESDPHLQLPGADPAQHVAGAGQ